MTADAHGATLGRRVANFRAEFDFLFPASVRRRVGRPGGRPTLPHRVGWGRGGAGTNCRHRGFQPRALPTELPGPSR